MSDPLDPTDAFRAAIVAYAGVIGVFIGGSALGATLWDAAQAFANVPSAGWREVEDLLKFDPIVLYSWFGVLMQSLLTWWAWLFLLAELWLVARLRSGADLFQTLFALTLIQPLHTLLIAFDQNSPTLGESIIGLLLLIGSEVAIATLILWWRRTSDAAPAEDEGSSGHDL